MLLEDHIRERYPRYFLTSDWARPESVRPDISVPRLKVPEPPPKPDDSITVQTLKAFRDVRDKERACIQDEVDRQREKLQRAEARLAAACTDIGLIDRDIERLSQP